MRSLILLFVLSIFILSCKQNAATDTAKTDTTKINFPFKPKYSINWQKGDEKNALIVLTCLKNYLAGDIKTAMKDFADTVTFIGDDFYFNGKRDSLAAIISQVRSQQATVTKEFDS